MLDERWLSGEVDLQPVGKTFAQISVASHQTLSSAEPALRGSRTSDRTILRAFLLCSVEASKGLFAWDANGDGFVVTVTTPDWPGQLVATG